MQPKEEGRPGEAGPEANYFFCAMMRFTASRSSALMRSRGDESLFPATASLASSYASSSPSLSRSTVEGLTERLHARSMWFKGVRPSTLPEARKTPSPTAQHVQTMNFNAFTLTASYLFVHQRRGRGQFPTAEVSNALTARGGAFNVRALATRRTLSGGP
ncbi:hypothetical protein MXAN_2086 [Myxococcus xanthus DK 1622]|uniref:Uncharacterized protein n=1 Tax=Myxococcus xanthus (strain DK1622) TaxID=246197 RepID=Q1DAK9_MYXXD|nr:hypothetical protein MXAN_2086 [Myxococcus xanthus DK 1622]